MNGAKQSEIAQAQAIADVSLLVFAQANASKANITIAPLRSEQSERSEAI